MLKLYCRHCGSPNHYTLDKPKFCQSCAQSFLTPTKPTKSLASTPLSTKNIEVEEDDVDDEEQEVFNVDLTKLKEEGLNIDITVDNPRHRTDTMGDIMEPETPSAETTIAKKRGRPKGSKNKPKSGKTVK